MTSSCTPSTTVIDCISPIQPTYSDLKVHIFFIVHCSAPCFTIHKFVWNFNTPQAVHTLNIDMRTQQLKRLWK
jgi:hypothetical protein